ncbi:MAG: tRNA pseudouridine(38-40) synthase TruA [Rhodocyclaceae bacterium]|nr:tRNA pseudouridine(38-40) synthase TruA [Rhodocyclaceae bacterium]MBK6552730.1 tRNA pseudouridine(38-40) synthase TruA [Rhodocyclaceae bacterium]MBK9312268.1 tRNA pseudouridine(38-40) synthase TruA [Rhodocyclaceae bacterium]MBK9956071.1 tRNA pseudouridine(38-40) synthase TruA [Rhodocyclaceae bacterium]
MRIVIGLEYDGSTFTGWQSQPHGNTVQDVLEHALSQVADSRIRTVCAGRTDTGVHALAQVAHFDTQARRPLSAWVRGVNALLPPTVAIHWAAPVAGDFHARFSAVSRRYRYLLLNRPVRPALQSGRAGWFHRPLDVAAMTDGARHLLGEHDFTAFRAAQCQAKSPIRVLQRASVSRHDEFVVLEFQANAFLHHMVRNLVGALVYVGQGKHPPAWIGQLLAGRDRARAAPTFDAAGLYFLGADYDAGWGLPLDAIGAPRPVMMGC